MLFKSALVSNSLKHDERGVAVSSHSDRTLLFNSLHKSLSMIRGKNKNWNSVLLKVCFSFAALIVASRAKAMVDLGIVPLADPQKGVRLEQWSTIPGNIQQMTFLGDNLFFATQEGQVWQYDSLGNRNTTAFLDVAAQRGGVFGNNPVGVSNGLRGIAFHPDFSNDSADGFGKLYSMHTESRGGTATHTLDPAWNLGNGSNVDSVLFEWSFNASGSLTGSREVYRVQYPAGHHPGQQIVFNPTAGPGDSDYGNLYLAFGDSGGIAPGSNNFSGDNVTTTAPQELDNVLGKIVRINPLQDSGNPFSIPSDNPFATDSNPNTLDDIWASGFRNPQTLSFDTATGELLVGNIGQNNVEEIELVEAGTNHGWAQREGTFEYLTPFDSNTLSEISLANRQSDPYTYPVAQFDHINNGGSSAIVGGYVYHGNLAGELRGEYVFGNLSNDRLYIARSSDLTNDETPASILRLPLIDAVGDPITLGEIVGVGSGGRANIRFGQDQSGEIYVISKTNDTIYRFEGTEVPPIPSILGDLDLDSDVDEDDVANFVAGWKNVFPQPSLESWQSGDLDQNAIVDLADVFILHEALVEHLGQGFPFSSLNVPEPATATQLVGFLLSMLAVRRRSRIVGSKTPSIMN